MASMKQIAGSAVAREAPWKRHPVSAFRSVLASTVTFTPPVGATDDRIVRTQATDPTSLPDECIEPPVLTVSVTYGAPPGVPPDLPCQVPELLNTASGTAGATAISTWQGAGFAAANLTFRTPPPLPYTIKTQSLLAGSYQACTVAMNVTGQR